MMPDVDRFAAMLRRRLLPTGRRGRARAALTAAAMMLAVAAAGESPVLPAPKIDPAVLARAADLAYSRDLARARAGKALNADAGMVTRMHRAAEPLISYAWEIQPAAAGWAWILSVETRPEAIAYCLPAGKILVSSALIERVKLNPDEFAAIVAHVIAHALIGQDALDAVAAYERTRKSATADPDVNRAALQLADALAKVVQSDHYDAAAEKAADAVALDLMARSGIDPGTAAGAWRKVAEARGTAPQELAVLHPVTPERIAAIEAQMPAVTPVYRNALATHLASPPAPPMPRR
jgi:Zn-dependent protease with chaperone function